MKKTVKSINKTVETYNLIKQNEHIVLGLSGGPDSVCLFDYLKCEAERYNINIYPVHVNHCFRPGAADDDEKYVRSLCEKNGLECRVFRVDCVALSEERGISSEEAGREARYNAFKKVADEIAESGVDPSNISVAVAQNADDRAETVLFRIIRGTGTDGIEGIRHVRDFGRYRVIRPLLDTWRSDIEDYCKEKELKPVTDETNLKPLYTRNKIRLELIPYIEENFNPEVKEALTRLADIAAEDRECFEKISESAFKYCCNDMTEPKRVLLSCKKLKKEQPAVRKRIMAAALRRLGLSQNTSKVHYDGMENILFNDSPSAEMNLPQGYRIFRRYDELAIEGPKEGNFGEDKEKAILNWQDKHGEIAKTRIIPISEYDENMKNNGGTLFFDYELFKKAGFCEKIILRSRRPGDWIHIKNGRKKIKKLLIDAKVPKENRDLCILCARGSEVLAVITPSGDRRYTSQYKINNDTKIVIGIELVVTA